MMSGYCSIILDHYNTESRVIMNRHLTMADHVAAVCRAGYYRLRQLRPTVRSLPIDAAKTLIQAFISNRLDYCNAALCGITDTLLRKLQSVQNVPARLLIQTGRQEHITPVLRQLHWLPVSRRIDFKLAMLMYQISRGLALTYLQDRCRLASEVSSGRRLRSTNVPTFVVPRTRTKLGDRSFAAAGPRLWNSLPWPLRQSETLMLSTN